MLSKNIGPFKYANLSPAPAIQPNGAHDAKEHAVAAFSTPISFAIGNAKASPLERFSSKRAIPIQPQASHPILQPKKAMEGVLKNCFAADKSTPLLAPKPQSIASVTEEPIPNGTAEETYSGESDNSSSSDYYYTDADDEDKKDSPKQTDNHKKSSDSGQPAQELRCEKCGKVYKHANCFVKHRWEHQEEAWELTRQFCPTKHQQVMALEAAAILASMIGVPTEIISSSRNRKRSTVGAKERISRQKRPRKQR